MATIKLKPWPFQNRIVKLHWFGHVRLKSLNQWRITVAFEDCQQISLVEYPVGILPILRIGQYYQEGQAMISQKVGLIDTAYLENLSQGYPSTALEVCRKFNYFLHGKAELITQKMWSIPSGELTYHIPHVELMRAFYVKNKIIANAMLRPNGIEYFLDKHSINGNFVSFEFSKGIPASLLSDDFVQHFTWLYTSKEIRQSFESIQTNVYANAMTHGLSGGQPLEMTIPSILNSQWTYRGKRIEKEIFIFELLGFTGIELPVDQIEYSHPSIKNRVYRVVAKKKQISKIDRDQKYEIEGEKPNDTKEDTNQQIVDQESTQMIFQRLPNIKRIAKYDQEINQGDTYFSKTGRGGAITRIASVDDSILGGSIQPIDFKTLEISFEQNGFGLEDFYEMIKLLENLNSEAVISMTLVNLPLGRTYSWLSDGRRRACAVVRIDRPGRLPLYILEVARPDNRSLSTLILQTNTSKDRLDEEEQMYAILKGVTFNGGNWRKDQLNKVNHVKLKHTSKTSNDWAYRVNEKLKGF
jgi:hypothetical protein